MDKTAVDRSSYGATLWSRLYSPVFEWIGARLLGTPRYGAITFVLPNGRSRTLGTPHTGEHAVMRLKNYRVLWETMRRGSVGFAASYIRGDVEVDDLTALFRNFLQNKRIYDDGKEPGMFRKAAKDLASTCSRPNSKEGAKENISEHYDLGNDFYGEWLDPSMTYSSALFASGNQSLEEAQRAKYHRIADMAGVSRGRLRARDRLRLGRLRRDRRSATTAPASTASRCPASSSPLPRSASRGRASTIARPCSSRTTATPAASSTTSPRSR